MIEDQHNNILVKINNIRDNINQQNKAKSSAFQPFLLQNDNINFKSIYNYYYPYLWNNYTKEDSTEQSQMNLQNNSASQIAHFVSNKKEEPSNSINISTNSIEDHLFKKEPLKKDESVIYQAKKNTKGNNDDNLAEGKIFKKFEIFHIEYPIIDKVIKKKGKSFNKKKHKRKYNADDIRKKIKARFHKSIKNIINENLRKAGSKKLFTFLPQIFVSSISREKNRRVLNMSFRDLLQSNFVNDVDGNKYKNKNVDFAKYQRNLSVLKYLDDNPEICKNSGFDLISKMKYADLLNEYFRSDEFNREIDKLRKENEDEHYISEYINKSKTYVKFFKEMPVKIEEDNSKKISEIKRPEENNKIEVLISK